MEFSDDFVGLDREFEGWGFEFVSLIGEFFVFHDFHLNLRYFIVNLN
jgi:hypothetical protein